MSSSLPPLYARWVDELLGAPIPDETEATCDDCVMCAHDAAGAAGDLFFDPSVKCCTYLPLLANFLVGRALADDDPEAAVGRRSVADRVRAGVAVTPLGLGRPTSYMTRYQLDSERSFGRSRAQRCPHYLEEGGRCGVWRHRESTCATWFCKHARGALGWRFWRESMQPLLARVERELARWCLLSLDPGDEAMALLLPTAGGPTPLDAADVDGAVDPARHRALWGRWAGREEAFFRACADLVEPLRWADVLAATGPEVRLRAAMLGRAHARLTSDATPPALRLGALEVVGLDARGVRLRTYSLYDPIELPRPLFDLLHHFEAADSTEGALAAARDEDGVELDPELVLRLVDFAVLVPR